jgi:exonuclease I
MTYVSIDIETTGLDPETCQVVEIAAVVDDLSDTPIEELPAFRYVCVRDAYVGEPYALAMHARLFEQIALRAYRHIDGHAYEEWWDKPGHFSTHFTNWLRPLGINPRDFVVTGKNFANFDARFLRRMSGVNEHIRWHHRILDPGSMYARSTDDQLPSTGECCERAGIHPADIIDGSAHEALFDARVVVALVREALL